MELNLMMAASPAGGWAVFVFVLGPMLAGLTFVIVRRRRNARLIAGAAALLAMVWCVLISDWLPPSWVPFFRAHGITVSTVISALLLGAGWLGLEHRLVARRQAALHTTWSRWLEEQGAFVGSMIEGPPNSDIGVFEQRVRAADLRARLELQQQWTAAMFTIIALQTDEDGIEQIGRIGRLRDIGSDVVREFTKLEVLLDRTGAEHLPAATIDAVWRAPLFHLGRLADCLDDLRKSVRADLWDTQTRAGDAPTHEITDVDTLKVSRATGWTP